PQLYVYAEDKAVVGMAGFAITWLDWNTYALCWVVVDQSKRMCGVGRALVDRCLQDLSNMASYVVLSTNVPEFYSKNWNFKPIDKTKDGSVLMSLDLTDPGVARRYK